MTRIRSDFVFGVTDTALSNVDTTLSSPQLTRLPAISGGDYAAVTLYDSTTGVYEIVYVTAHTAAATTATITRAQEGSTAQAWATGSTWLQAPTAMDLNDASNFSTGTLPDARMPSRLGTIGVLLTSADNLNAITDSGWYWSTSASVPTNAPGSDAYAIQVIKRDTNFVAQVAYRFSQTATAKAWVRSSSSGVWSAWSQILLDGDSISTANLTGTVLDAQIPDRLGSTATSFNSVRVTDDWNNYVMSGWYHNDTASIPANHPEAGGSFSVIVNGRGATNCTQIAVKLSTNSALYTRRLSGGTWGAWVQYLMAVDDGSGLTNLDASNIALGTISDTRLPAVMGGKTLTTTTLTGTTTIGGPSSAGSIELGRSDGTNSSAFIDFHSGPNVTDFDARIIAPSGSGGASNGWGQLQYTANGGHSFAGTVSGTFSGNGAALTSLNASNLSSGTVPPARLGNLSSFLTAVTAASASSTYANTGLTITLDAGQNYMVYAGGTWSASTTVPTMGLRTGGTATFNSVSFQQWIASTTGTSTNTMQGSAATAIGGLLLGGAVSTAATTGLTSPWSIQGFVRCNAAGTLTIQYARAGGASGNVYVGPGSYLTAIPI